MSEIGLNFGDESSDRGHGGQPEDGYDEHPGDDRRRPRRGRGCVPLLLVAAVFGVAAWFGGSWAVDRIQARFADAPDYAGPGTGEVVVEVTSGATATKIGQELEAKGVVKSVAAFTEAARADARSQGIQVGFYQLKKEMKASEALEVLIDPANAVVVRVAVPEGLRVADIVATLAKQTDYSKAQFARAARNARALGLPAYAGGDAEGYLFPATYDFGPKDRPVDMLRTMVDRWRQAAESLELESGARELGYDPHELMTIAALVEAEGRGEDMPRIARVIYNRLENPGTAGTTGKLEIDATVNYALGRNLGVAISPEDLQVDSPYNTRLNPGLPPGPIEAPGEEAMRAALEPATGDWYYYVTVNLRTGETKFAENYDEFLQYKAEFRDYCRSSDAC